MQNEFGNFPLPDLIDLLAIYTKLYTHMMKVGSLDSKFKEYEELIFHLQTEIQGRKTKVEEHQNLESDPGLIPVLA